MKELLNEIFCNLLLKIHIVVPIDHMFCVNHCWINIDFSTCVILLQFAFHLENFIIILNHTKICYLFYFILFFYHNLYMGQGTGNTDSLDSSRPGLGRSHHLPPYGILYVTPLHPHPNGSLSWDSQGGVLKLSRFGLPRFHEVITICSDLRLGWGLKQTCSFHWELLTHSQVPRWTHLRVHLCGVAELGLGRALPTSNTIKG
jgi:hypothetical protein